MNRVERMRKRRRRNLIASIIIAVIIFISLLVTYYIYVQKPLWQQRNTVIAHAMSTLDLIEVTNHHRFVTDHAYDIVSGIDADGKRWYVACIENEEVNRIAVEETIDEQRIIEQLASEGNRVKILRILPGIWEGQWVWEVFYKMEESEGVRHRYNYYDLTDGTLLEMYRLRLTR